MATASAVVADIIDCALHAGENLGIGWSEAEDGYVLDQAENVTAMYVRARGCKTCIIEKAKELFGEITLLSRSNEPEDELAFVIGEEKEEQIMQKLASLEKAEIISTIRVVNY